MNLTIRAKMIISSLSFILTILFISILSTYSISKLEERYSEIIENTFPSYASIRDAAVDIHQAIIAQREMIQLDISSSAYDDALKTYNKNIRQSEERLESLSSLSLDSNTKEALTEYNRLRESWLKSGEKIISLLQSGNTSEASSISRGIGYEEFDAMEEALDGIGDKINKNMIEVKEIELQELNKRLKGLYILIIIGIAISTSLGLIIIHDIVKKIKGITHRVQEISQGDGDLTYKIEIKGSDEISTLSSSLNTFIFKIHQIVIELKKESELLLNIKDNLKNLTEETAASTHEIDTNIVSIKEQINNLANNIESADANINHLSRGADDLDKAISLESESINNSTNSIKNMAQSISAVREETNSKIEVAESLKTLSKAGGEKLLTTTNYVENINSVIEDISQMISIINGIAASTNLLAMNAAIEAAHAGDSGKGFSVVADEIRKLAENSSSNAKKISSVIKGVLNNIKLASENGKEAEKAFNQINSDVNLVSQAFSEISDSADKLSNESRIINDSTATLIKVSEKVKKSSNEMSRLNSEVNSSIESVKRVSVEVGNAIGEITFGTGQISDAVNQVNELALKLSDSSNKVYNHISTFKT